MPKYIKHYLICFMREDLEHGSGWLYSNEVIDIHPTAWLRQRISDKGKFETVLVSFQEIMPSDYNMLVNVL